MASLGWIFQGCDPEIREEVWPYLLRLVSPSSTAEQRSALRADLARRYSDLLQRCQVSITLCSIILQPTLSNSTVSYSTTPPCLLQLCELMASWSYAKAAVYVHD